MVTAESGTQLIDDHVSVEQSKRAITSLLRHVRKEQVEEEETQLLPGKEQHVWLVLTVKRMQPMKNLKPHKIPIVHPLVDPRTASVCLITKDPQREYKDLLESHSIKFISRVVGIAKLRGKFKGFDARRLLLRENGLFLTDERVLPLLPGLLGKKWFDAKKQPIPVSLTKKDLKKELEKAVSSTYMHQNRGTCTSIKIATLVHKDTQVLANIRAAIPAVVAHIHGGWDNVQSLNIKTSNSVSLPIWTCPLGSDDPGSRWAGMVVDEDEWGGFGAGGGADDVAAEVQAPKLNGKRRVADPGEMDGGEKKKVKRAQSTAISTLTSTKTVEPAPKAVKEPKRKRSRTSVTVDPTTLVHSQSGPTKSRKSPHLDATQTTIKLSSMDPTGSRMPVDTVSPGPDKQSTTRKPRKKCLSKSSPPGIASPSLEPAGPADTPKKKPAQPSLSRDELKKKKVGDGKMDRKKERLRETEKSARKRVKAQLVGRVKA